MKIKSTESEIESPRSARDDRAVKLMGLDLSAIGNGIVKVKAPLKGGTFHFVAPHDDAIVAVRKSTTAQVSFGVSTATNTPRITGANISFSPSITIKNPATSLRPSHSRLARFVDVDYLKDKVADLVICGIHVGKDGQLHLDGYLKLGPFSKKKLSDVFKSDDLPKLSKDAQGGLNLETLLKDLGLVLNEATFSIETHSNQARHLDLDAFGVKAWTEAAEAHSKVRGTARLSRNNSIHLNVDQNQSRLRFGKTSAAFGGEIRIEPTSKTLQSHILFDVKLDQVQGQVKASERKDIALRLNEGENRIRGHAFVFRDANGHVSVKDASSIHVEVGAQSIGDLQVGSRKIYGQLHDVNAKVQLKANFFVDEGTLNVSAGEASANLSAQDFQALYEGLDFRAPGTYGIDLRVPSFRYGRADKIPSAQGEVQLNYAPTTLSKTVPSVASFKSQLLFALKGDGTAQAQHVQRGVTEFLKPFCDLDPRQRAPALAPGVDCSPIGSPEFQKRCEIIAQSPVRSNNNAELLIDGITSLPKRLELIGNAKKSICLQTLVFKEDKAGIQIADALCAAVQRGVDVKVIVDALGNATSLQEVLMLNPVYTRLMRGGVQLELHNNSIGEGLKDVFGALSKSSKISDILDLDDLSNPQKIFSKLNLFARAALREVEIGLSDTEANLLALGLSRILGSERSQVRPDLLRHLAKITEDNILEVSELLDFIKNNAHLNQRWHEKYLIVDYDKAIVGGINAASEYLEGGTGSIVTVGDKTSEAWRDTDVYLHGEAARDAFQHFADNYKDLTGKQLECDKADELQLYGDTHVQMVHSRPSVDQRSTILDLTVECLGSLKAGDKAYLENSYFVTSGRAMQLEGALIDAARRGVDVRVLMNSEKSIDVKEVAHAAVFSQRRLLEGGVRIFERSGDQMMHSKAVVFAGQVAAIGSWNADNRASSLNAESSAFIHDASFAKQVEDMITRDMGEQVAREVHLADIAFLPLAKEARNTLQAMMSDQL